MKIVLILLLLLDAIVLIFLVLIQNSKGGGLTGAIGGVSQAAQFIGMRRATEEVEKWTWWSAGLLVIFSLLLNFFLATSYQEGTENPTQLRMGESINTGPVTSPTSVPQFPSQNQNEQTPNQ